MSGNRGYPMIDKKVILMIWTILNFVLISLLIVGFYNMKHEPGLKERCTYPIVADIIDTKVETLNLNKSGIEKKTENAYVNYKYKDNTYATWLPHSKDVGHYNHMSTTEFKINPDNPTEIYMMDDLNTATLIFMAFPITLSIFLNILLYKVFKAKNFQWD